jgi:hypothetical protein
MCRALYLGFAILSACLTSIAQPLETVITPAEEGQYQGDRRVGVWQFYDRPSTVALKVDYDKSDIFFEPDISDYTIYKNGSWVKSKLQIPCRFHGSTVSLKSHYEMNVFLPADMAQQERDVEAILTFEVNEDGFAINPNVEGNSLGELSETILRAFETAPNSWITGVTHEGHAVKCKMAIAFSFNHRVALQKTDDAKLILTINQFSRIIPRVNFNPTFFSNGIKFSDDDNKVCFGLYRRTDKILSVIDIKSAKTDFVPYTNVNETVWLNNNQLLFTYKYSAWPIFAAVYDANSKRITHKSDSVTRSHHVLPKRARIGFTTFADGNSYVWTATLDGSKKELITTESTYRIVGNVWSPDEQKLLCNLQDKFNKWTVIDIPTKERITIPLYSSAFVGWSADGKSIFLAKAETRDYSIQTEFFRFDIETKELISLFKQKRVHSLDYDAGSDKLLLNIGGSIYLTSFKTPDERTLLVKNAGSFKLSHNLNLLAYVSTKNEQMHVYDMEKKTSYQVSQWIID